MAKKYLVSIIITNYNYGRFLEDAIKSALNQTYKLTEVIVVDDGSTDNSKEIIENYDGKIIPVLKDHTGHVSAWNAGIVKSRGDIICFLDSDDIFFPNKVEKVIKVFEKHTHIGWCFHYLNNVDSSGASLGTHGEIYEEPPSGLINLQDAIYEGKVRLPYYAPPTSGLCFKRSILSAMSPLPECIRISDDYFLKLAAFYLSSGYHISEKLGIRRFHENNVSLYIKSNIQVKVDQNVIRVAFYLREKFPESRKFTDKIFARALGRILARDYKRIREVRELNQYIKRYYSPLKWLYHSPRITINIIRTLNSKGPNT